MSNFYLRLVAVTVTFLALLAARSMAANSWRAGLFLIGLIWSIWLADRILVRQGAAAARRWIPLLPGAAGSIAVGIAWWPAIFGV